VLRASGADWGNPEEVGVCAHLPRAATDVPARGVLGYPYRAGRPPLLATYACAAYLCLSLCRVR